MHSLNSARLKIRRAHVHINALKRSIMSSFNPQYAIREQTISQGPLKGFGVITINIDPSARVEIWGLIIGDVVTNLRDSLDHIAWALAMLQVRETGKKLTIRQERSIHFPLYDDSAAENDKQRLVRDLKYILPRAHSEIKRFQPYNEKDWPELSLLRDLNLLANADKHRLVTPSNIRANIKLTEDDSGIVMNLIKKRNSMFLNTGQIIEPNITYEIAVYPRGPFRPMNLSTLYKMHTFIRDEVISAFESFFPNQ